MKLAVGLGSSLGDRRARLERTLVRLDHTPGMRLVRASRWIRTPPLAGGTATGWFLNGVALLETDRTPDEVLVVCIALEEQAGRRRARFWGDRTLDLDLLLAEGVAVASDRLVLPHPAIARRRFVLEPLLEVWPDARDPRTGQAYAELPRPPGPRPVPWGVVARGRPLRYL